VGDLFVIKSLYWSYILFKDRYTWPERHCTSSFGFFKPHFAVRCWFFIELIKEAVMKDEMSSRKRTLKQHRGTWTLREYSWWYIARTGCVYNNRTPSNTRAGSVRPSIRSCIIMTGRITTLSYTSRWFNMPVWVYVRAFASTRGKW
jgi:hypothetical protein